jgi:hypothetical protein
VLCGLAIGGCYLYFPDDLDPVPDPPPPPVDRRALRSSAREVTLAWNGVPAAVSYRIHYRRHGRRDWRLLDEVPAEPLPQYTVRHESLGNGTFDFAVTAVYGDGEESELHTSLDPMAVPGRGWYLRWTR